MDCKERALKYIEIRLRSEWELRSYLRKKEYTAEEIEHAVAFLTEYGYLNDREFARAFVQDKINFNPCGRNKLYVELRKKGVANDVIKTILAQYFTKEQEMEVAEKILQKQVRLEGAPLKQAQYLKAKGFSVSVISALIEFDA